MAKSSFGEQGADATVNSPLHDLSNQVQCPRAGRLQNAGTPSNCCASRLPNTSPRHRGSNPPGGPISSACCRWSSTASPPAARGIKRRIGSSHSRPSPRAISIRQPPCRASLTTPPTVSPSPHLAPQSEYEVVVDRRAIRQRQHAKVARKVGLDTRQQIREPPRPLQPSELRLKRLPARLAVSDQGSPAVASDAVEILHQRDRLTAPAAVRERSLTRSSAERDDMRCRLGFGMFPQLARRQQVHWHGSKLHPTTLAAPTVARRVGREVTAPPSASTAAW